MRFVIYSVFFVYSPLLDQKQHGARGFCSGPSLFHLVRKGNVVLIRVCL
jgi:hypothetical protein